MSGRPSSRLDRTPRGDGKGLHLAVNIFTATTLPWLQLRTWTELNPIRAISSMVAPSEPVVTQVARPLRGCIVNSLFGSAAGMAVLVVGWALARLWPPPEKAPSARSA